MTRDLYPRPRRRSWAEELDELVAGPPPTFAELEAVLAAHGITGLGPKPMVTCPKCKALAPNHLTRCKKVRMPDPDAKRCEKCPYPSGSLGCRMACGGAG